MSEKIDTIICGDCIEVLPQIPDASVDLIITDPPYFAPTNTYSGTRLNYKAGQKRRFSDYGVLNGLFQALVVQFKRIAKEEAQYYIFCDARSYSLFYPVLFNLMQSVGALVWDKQTSVSGYTWRHQFELVLWGNVHKWNKIPTGDGDVIRHRAVPVEKRVHQAEKPVPLLEQLIFKSSKEGGLVIDPFCGSAATCVAAKGSGRHYIGIDIDEEYCKIAEKRLAEMLQKWKTS